MKKNILFYGLSFVAVVAGLISCKRDYTLKDPVSTAGGSAFLRIIDAAPNFSAIFGQPDSFSVFVSNIKISGYTPGTTPVMTYNGLFPTISTLYGYAAVPAGTQPVKLSVSGTINPDSIQIKTFTKTMLANQFYTFLITDSINSARDSSQIFVQDSYQLPTAGFYNLRFIHAVMNDTAGTTIDIWSTRTNRYIFTAVKPGTITSFTQYPSNALYSDTLYVRRTGSALTLDTLNGVNFSTQRTYTLYYKGNGNSNSNADIKRRHLATYVHQ